jgi:hypothetical protein
MRVKMKIRQKFKFTATAAILAFGIGNKGYSQHTSQAVMSIQVTVVSGSNVSNNTISDISDQIQNTNSKLSFGDFKLQFSDGVDFVVKQDESIMMRGENSNWLINTNMLKDTNPKGQVTIRMSGEKLSNVPAGTYEGRHLTEIHYL